MFELINDYYFSREYIQGKLTTTMYRDANNVIYIFLNTYSYIYIYVYNFQHALFSLWEAIV